jgi:hypothetical protein
MAQVGDTYRQLMGDDHAGNRTTKKNSRYRWLK